MAATYHWGQDEKRRAKIQASVVKEALNLAAGHTHLPRGSRSQRRTRSEFSAQYPGNFGVEMQDDYMWCSYGVTCRTTGRWAIHLREGSCNPTSFRKAKQIANSLDLYVADDKSASC
ncbi:MAG: hypothetical protein Fues2KO_04350 [Fuerstiella sp.]